MKRTNLLPGLIAATIFVAAGCGKEKPPTPPQVEGVTVDIPKLDQAFLNASSELRGTETQVGMNVRYQKYKRTRSWLWTSWPMIPM